MSVTDHHNFVTENLIPPNKRKIRASPIFKKITVPFFSNLNKNSLQDCIFKRPFSWYIWKKSNFPQLKANSYTNGIDSYIFLTFRSSMPFWIDGKKVDMESFGIVFEQRCMNDILTSRFRKIFLSYSFSCFSIN